MLSNFPSDLIMEVIDTIATDTEISSTELSNISLVSRICRARSSFHRFSNLELFIHGTPTHRILALEALLGSDVWRINEGISKFVRSLSLILGARWGDRGTFLHGPCRNAAFSRIIKLIGEATSSDHELSVVLGSERYCLHRGRDADSKWQDGYPFTMLSSNLVSAVHALLCSSAISHLTVQYVWDVPNTLISGSRTTHLNLENVHFVRTGLELEAPLQALRNLEIQNSPSFLPAVLGAHIPPIRRLKCWINRREGCQMLYDLRKKLSAYVVNIDRDMEIPCPPIDNQFLVSESLTFEHFYDEILVDKSVAEEWETKEDPQAQPIFLNIFNLLPGIIPPSLVIDISATLRYYLRPETLCYGLDHIYSHIYHPSLIERLNECSSSGDPFTSKIKIEIYFVMKFGEDYDPERFSSISEAYLRNLLSPLDELDGVKLDIEVASTLDDHPNAFRT